MLPQCPPPHIFKHKPRSEQMNSSIRKCHAVPLRVIKTTLSFLFESVPAFSRGRLGFIPGLGDYFEKSFVGASANKYHQDYLCPLPTDFTSRDGVPSLLSRKFLPVILVSCPTQAAPALPIPPSLLLGAVPWDLLTLWHPVRLSPCCSETGPKRNLPARAQMTSHF